MTTLRDGAYADAFVSENSVRPLLTFDVRNRKRSGRHQISSEGYKLYDGLAYGKTLTRALANRPEIKIPPRKRRKVTYAEEDGLDGEDVAGLIGAEEEGDHSLLPDPSTQLVLHNVLGGKDADEEEEEDDEDDDDFDPDAKDDDEETSSQSSKNSQTSEGSQKSGVSEIKNNGQAASRNKIVSPEEDAELLAVSEATQQDKVAQLCHAFPAASEGVCAGVLIGLTDLSKAYDALNIGFYAHQSKQGLMQALATKVIARAHSMGSDQGLINNDIPNTERHPQADTPFVEPKTSSQAKRTQQSNSNANTARSPRASQPEIDLPLLATAPEHDIGETDNNEDLHGSGKESEEEISSLARHYDQNGFPPGSILGGKLITFGTDSVIAPSSRITSPQPAQQGSKHAVSSSSTGGLTIRPFINFEQQHSCTSTSLSADSSDDVEAANESVEDDSESNSSGDSSSSDSDSEPSSLEKLPRTLASRRIVASSENDSSSSSDSSSDEEPEVASSKIMSENEPIHGRSSATELTVKKAANHFHGRTATRERNARRTRSLKLNRLKDKGVLPRDTTSSEFSKLDVDFTTAPADALVALEQLRASRNGPLNAPNLVKHPQGANSQAFVEQSQGQAQEFAARREELLAALAAGGVEVGPPSPASDGVVPEASPVSNTQEGSLDDRLHQRQVSGRLRSVLVGGSGDVHETETFQVKPASLTPKVSNSDEIEAVRPSESTESTPRTRTTKWDAGAGRRLLFGHLGVKTPRNKAEEESVRQKLLDKARPMHPVKSTQAIILEDTHKQLLDKYDDWEGRINYSAVECVQEGIILSAPPFPFVQRWDPQQKLGGKRKSTQRDNGTEDAHASKKQKRRDGNLPYAEEQDYLDESYQPSFPDTLDYDDSSQITSQCRGNMRTQSQDSSFEIADLSNLVGEEIPEDLAPLPENIAVLSDLSFGGARKGMTIAFKTLVMNERWEPIQSDYRTAIVIEVFDNGDLSVALAKRDRKQKKYDAETGARVYDKFEMPSDDEDEDDDGMLTLSFAELSGPKIVLPAPSDLVKVVANANSVDGQSETQPLHTGSESQISVVAETQERDADVYGVIDVAQDGMQTNIALPNDATQSTQLSRRNMSRSPTNSILNDEFGVSQSENVQESQILPDGQQSHITETKFASDVIPSDDGQQSEVFFESQEPQRSLSVIQPSKSGDTEAHAEEDDAFHEASKQLVQEAASTQFSRHTARHPPRSRIQEPFECGGTPPQASRDASPRSQFSQVSQSVQESVQTISPTPLSEQTRSHPLSGQCASSPLLLPDGTSDVLAAGASAKETSFGIAKLIKEAGSRSEVPSSVTKGFTCRASSIPGDSHVFEQLMQEVESRSDAVYSPKFTDYSPSSPTRAKSVTRRTQAPKQQADQSSCVTVDEPLSSQAPASSAVQPSQGQSSWITVDEPLSSQVQIAKVDSTGSTIQDNSPPSSPPPPMLPVSTTRQDDFEEEFVSDGSQGWETDSEPAISASRPKKATGKKTAIPKPRKRVPIGQDWGIWAEIAGEAAEESASPGNRKAASTRPHISDAEDLQTSVTISCPKLSIESSFTSTIADLGRQSHLDPEEQDVDESSMKETPSTLIAQDRAIPAQTPEANIVADLTRSAAEPTLQSHLQRFVCKSPISARIAALLKTPMKVASPSIPEPTSNSTASQATSSKKPVHDLDTAQNNVLLISPSPEPVEANNRAATDQNQPIPSSSASHLPVIAESDGLLGTSHTSFKVTTNGSGQPTKPWSFDELDSSEFDYVQAIDSTQSDSASDEASTRLEVVGSHTRHHSRNVPPVSEDLDPDDDSHSNAVADERSVIVEQPANLEAANSDVQPYLRQRSPVPADVDSDDDFPSIEEVLSQRVPKIKKSPRMLRPQDHKQTMVKQTDKPSLHSGPEDSFTSGGRSVSRPTPPAERRISNGKSYEGQKGSSRDPLTSASHLSAALKQPNISPQQVSAPKSTGAFIDLTQSSDVEDESSYRPPSSMTAKHNAAPTREVSSPEPFKSFLSQYSVDSDDLEML